MHRPPSVRQPVAPQQSSPQTTHEPSTQCSPLSQGSQPPQCAESFKLLTHCESQQMSSGSPVHALPDPLQVQLPVEQSGASSGASHAIPQPPQFALSLANGTQAPKQSTRGASQTMSVVDSVSESESESVSPSESAPASSLESGTQTPFRETVPGPHGERELPPHASGWTPVSMATRATNRLAPPRYRLDRVESRPKPTISGTLAVEDILVEALDDFGERLRLNPRRSS